MKKFLSLVVSLIILSNVTSAKEGMWLPMLLKSLNEGDMQSMGLKLSADDIYSINQSSLKDAIVSFGGFCTGEIISDKGLILTNHHCGYGQIQSHSSVENDYLTNGYWAMNHSQELKNPGLTATFIVRMEDVTAKILEGIDSELKESERQGEIRKRINNLVEETTKDSDYGAYIRPFFYGNEYYMFVTETFNDVRLVGAPPSAIGKFGGDTDNWMWPRHTGDFSLFRIYADKDNKPAEYSEDNVPYTPKHYLPISMSGIKKGDFTMVYGFPGRTQEYLTSYAIQQIKEVINPDQIAIRAKALKIMDKHMKASDKVRIQYASKYARISNYWKKWIGENGGLQKANAISLKQDRETAFLKATKGMKEYEGLLNEIEKRYLAIEKYALARSYFVEIPYRKMEMLRLANRFTSIINQTKKGEEIDEKTWTALKEKVALHLKNFDLNLDLEISAALIESYKEGMAPEFVPSIIKSKATSLKFYKLYTAKSVFVSEDKINGLLNNWSKGKAKKVEKDPVYKLMKQFWNLYAKEVRPAYNAISNEIDSLSKIYVKGLRENVPGTYYPDANSTLRLAYGQVDDYEPRDGVQYDYFTNTEGILEKYDSENVDFNLPGRLVELIEKKDFGKYADEDGSLHVCFTASNHTTGGNSGSPVINGNGELIGLNFDRNWEGTMSDINYDIDQCRNISVDIRYVLFVVDKYANAGHLVDEMKLVKTVAPVKVAMEK
ncbi:MAG: S46 family peptidase [Flavobacteriales bacterium]|nr:S46 family peptidase [Flavobacteriales bacterium]